MSPSETSLKIHWTMTMS